MSENWNAWNPNQEDEDLEEERKKAEAEAEVEQTDWFEASFGNKNEDKDSENEANIFSLPESDSIFGSILESNDEAQDDAENGDEAEAEDEVESEPTTEVAAEAENSPDEDILEQPTFTDEDPGEAALEQQTEAESDELEAEPEPAAEVIESSEEAQPAQEDEGELGEDSVLRFEQPEPLEEDELEAEPEPEVETPSETEHLSDEAEPADQRPEGGDQSPVISENEAEELQSHFDESVDPDETILEEPTFIEEEPPEIGEQETEFVAEELPEDEYNQVAATQSARRPLVGGRRPLVGVRLPDGNLNINEEIKPVSHNEALAADSVEDGPDAVVSVPGAEEDPTAEAEVETLAEAAAEQEEAAAEAEQAAAENQEEDNLEDLEEDTTPAAEALVYGAAMTEVGRADADQEGDDKLEEREKKIAQTNNELSGSEHSENLASSEEVQPEALLHNYDVNQHDPEAANFDRRQESLSQPQLKDEETYAEEAYGPTESNEMTPLSAVLADKEESLTGFAATDGSETEAASHENQSRFSLKSPFIAGVVVGLIIVVVVGLFLLFR